MAAPGSALVGSTWAYQKPWEDFFTVVNWDQRGVGKNFSPADSARLGATLSPERLAQDAAVVVEHLRRLLGPRPIVVMGFSYGTSIGPRLIDLHPDWFAAYVGLGQMANAESEDILYRETRRRAASAGDSVALRALDSIAPYPPRDRKPNYRELNVVRRYSALFDGNWYGKRTLDLYYALPAWGAAYSREEAELVGPASGWMGRHLVEGPNGGRPRIVERLAVPVVILAGRYDLMTPYDAARSYFDRLEAPSKQFVTFERSAHFVMLEEPGRFLLTLVRDILPLAGGSPEFAPR